MAGQLLLGVSPWSCGCPEGSEGLDIQDALSHTAAGGAGFLA